MKIVILAVAAVSLAGCATVVRGAKDNSTFESTPSGATVTATSISFDQIGPISCVTPCELELKRKRTWEVVFTKDGYQSARGILRPVVTGGGVASGAGNVIAGGLIGIGVDAGTGANLDLRPNPMKAELKPLGDAEASIVVYADAEEAAEAAEAEAKAQAKAEEDRLKAGGAPSPAAASADAAAAEESDVVEPASE